MALVGSLCFCTACGTLLDRPKPNQKNIPCDLCETSNHNNWPNLTTTASTPTTFPSALQRKKHSNLQAVPTEDVGMGATVKQECPGCGNEEMTFTEAQLRSADEGSTIFYWCPKCGHRFNTNN